MSGSHGVVSWVSIGPIIEKGGENVSEIKGQLLGLLIVLAIFGVVGGSLMKAFGNTSDTIVKRVEEQVSLM